MRMLASFSEMLPAADRTVSGATVSAEPVSGEPASGRAVGTRQLSPNDRMLHARVQGNKLGIFDLFFDSAAWEQVEAGQSKAAANGDMYYDVWTSFSTEGPARHQSSGGETPPALPAETESLEDRVLMRRYVIDAHVKPPKQLDADVELQFDVVRGGWRFLAFELSRFLQVQRVEADG